MQEIILGMTLWLKLTLWVQKLKTDLMKWNSFFWSGICVRHERDARASWGGNRIAKIEKPRTGGVPSNEMEWTITYYTYDAGGNAMATYTKEYVADGALVHEAYTLDEQFIYGSSRVGTLFRNIDLGERVSTPQISTTTGTIYNIDGSFYNIAQNSGIDAELMYAPAPDDINYEMLVGDKRYELSNHLGNVLEVVSDQKSCINIGGVIDHYLPDVKQWTHYYAYGMVMESGGDNDYRYSFQGQEADDEIKGEGNSINYTYRMHDPRVGRFFAVDPLVFAFPYYSPYTFSGNSVVALIELEGLEPEENDANYGKNHIFTNAPTAAEMVNATNTNWHPTAISKLEDAEMTLLDYKECGANIRIVVMFMHGSPGKAKALGDQISDINSEMFYMEGITAANVYKYVEYKRLLAIDPASAQEYKNQLFTISDDATLEEWQNWNELVESWSKIETLDGIVNTIEEGGIFVLASCYSGLCLEDGLELGAAISNLNTNIIVAISGDKVRGDMPLDKQLIRKESEKEGVKFFKGGQLYFGTEKNPIDYDKYIYNIRLNSTGDKAITRLKKEKITGGTTNGN